MLGPWAWGCPGGCGLLLGAGAGCGALEGPSALAGVGAARGRQLAAGVGEQQGIADGRRPAVGHSEPERARAPERGPASPVGGRTLPLTGLSARSGSPVGGMSLSLAGSRSPGGVRGTGRPKRGPKAPGTRGDSGEPPGAEAARQLAGGLGHGGLSGLRGFCGRGLPRGNTRTRPGGVG